jgi:UDP-N-acetylmuramoyl-tripeptide--D-alanyl-D-alanine ligase
MKAIALSQIIAALAPRAVRGNTAITISGVTRNLRELTANSLNFMFSTKSGWPLAPPQAQLAAIVTAAKTIPAAISEKTTIIQVADVEASYWRFIDFYRSLFTLPLIGVTGTCGKTTTKDMIKHLLTPDYNVQATLFSNNTLDLNLKYLLGINDQTEAGVFELGVTRPGNLLTGCRYFKPNIGIITTIGFDHLAGCQTLANYIQAKAELLAGMNYQGTIILNADDSNISQIDLSMFRGTVVYFGCSPRAHLRAIDIRYTPDGMSFNLIYGNRIWRDLLVPGFGEHNVYNALAAIAAVWSCGLCADMMTIATRMRQFPPLRRHLQICAGIKGCTLIDDTWSSNPTSATAALAVLQQLANGRPTIVVMGKMAMLGDSAPADYASVAASVVAAKVNHLVTVGGEAGQIAQAAVTLNMDPANIHACKDAAAAVTKVKELVCPGSVVLIKASMQDHFANLIHQLKAK